MTDKHDADLRQADLDAQLEFTRHVFQFRRKAEGVFNGDTGKIEPTRREDIEWTADPTETEWPGPAARARSPQFFRGWSHVSRLCRAVCRGQREVPADIQEKYNTDYGRIHERYMLAVVEVRMKAENEAHEAKMKALAKVEAVAHAESREGRLEKRRAQLANLQASLKKLQSKEASIRTRMRKVQASIRMLERPTEK